MSTSRQSDLLLRKAFDSIPYNVYTSLVTSIELEYSFFVCISKHASSQTEDRCGFTNAWHSRYDHVWHIAVSCDDFESFDGLYVSDDIVKEDRPILFYLPFGQ